MTRAGLPPSTLAPMVTVSIRVVVFQATDDASTSAPENVVLPPTKAADPRSTDPKLKAPPQAAAEVETVSWSLPVGAPLSAIVTVTTLFAAID